MSKPAFTPGIWRVAGYVDEYERDGAVAVVAHDGFIVAEVLKWPQQDANASLIAAAPDMYEALQATLLFHSASPWDCEKQNRWRELTGKDEASTLALCDLVRSDLAKAEGRSA